LVTRRVALRVGACDSRRMSSDRPPIPPERPLQVMVGVDERGAPTLDVTEGAFEQVYRVGGGHSEALFLALSRQKGHLPYRHARQRVGTVCVRATLSEHDELWSEFLELDRQLSSQLGEVTRSFLRAHVEHKAR
jgi:hypothetical protein